jgi:acetolactate synthase-1/2/3 large subunit
VIAVTGLTPAERRGRGATQETTPQALWSSLFAPGAVFDLAETLEHLAQLPVTLARLAEGVGRAGGFVAHVSVPVAQRRWTRLISPRVQTQPMCLGAAASRRLAFDLQAGSVRLVVGYGACHAAARLPELADRLDATVVVTPRAKGVFPEDPPRCVEGVGFAGHTDEDLAETPARRVLCLGTRLGEGASQWSGALAPAAGGRLVIVHPRGDVAGAYPGADQLVLRAPVEQVVDALLAVVAGTVHPEALIDGSCATVMAASGNAFAWGIRHLRLQEPRWRVSVGWGSRPAQRLCWSSRPCGLLPSPTASSGLLRWPCWCCLERRRTTLRRRVARFAFLCWASTEHGEYPVNRRCVVSRFPRREP